MSRSISLDMLSHTHADILFRAVLNQEDLVQHVRYPRGTGKSQMCALLSHVPHVCIISAPERASKVIVDLGGDPNSIFHPCCWKWPHPCYHRLVLVDEAEQVEALYPDFYEQLLGECAYWKTRVILIDSMSR